MKKSTELKQKLTSLKNSIKELTTAGKIEEAHGKIAEVENLNRELELALMFEAEEVENFAGTEVEATNTQSVDENVIFNKLLLQNTRLGKNLTAAERAHVENLAGTPGQVEAEDERGGYLVPKEQQTQIHEFKRQLVSLKEYVNVIPVNTLSGSMPLGVDAADKLIAFEELNEINQSNVTFGNIAWKVADYGDIIPISNTLLADEKANLTGYIGRRFSKKAVRTENEKILAIMATATKVSGTTYDDIKTALNVKLDPAVAMDAIIVTNQSGFDWLDKQKDAENRDILTPLLADPAKKAFRGREIVVLSDAEMPSTGKKLNFFVGSLTEAIVFFDRQGVLMAVSTDAGFTKNATLMRVVERFDVKAVDTGAIVNVEITPV